MSDIINVNDASFADDVLNADVPVLVDFWASWCAPCKAIAPVLEDLAAEYGDKVKIAKVEVTLNNETAAKYGIRNIPALLMFNKGEKVAQMVGAHPRSKIVQFIDENS